MEGDDLDYLLPPDCQSTYFDTWDRHNSIAFSTATKGLHNAPGENNCFVNSAVQVFWHLDVFRRSYRRLSGHTCMGNSCIFCALKVIFTQFQFSDQSSLHPDALRKALAETFVNQQRFQLGHMDDAAECFENILRRIHFHISSNHQEDACSAPHCLPHQKFALNIVEKVVCPCGASSNPLKFTEMVHYISAKALVSQARLMQETGDMLHPDRFGLLLRNTNAMGDIRDCPGGCGKSVQIRRTLLNTPDVVSIGLVWDSDHPTVETTTEVARNIGTTILLQDVFHSVMQDLRSLPKLQLVGLVCYYGKHYSTFVFHSKLQVWIYFDDATVREIGKCWEDVVDKCSKGRYQPLLLLYANPNATPVPVETAPKKRTMAPGYGIPGGPDEDSSLDGTHESISYSRSRTPNPEPSHQQKKQALLPRARSVTPSASEWEGSGSFGKTVDHSRQQSFIMAVSSKPENKHPLKLGGQAVTGGNVPGPMVPVSDQRNGTFYPLSYSSQSSAYEDDNYSDYTLSASGQYRRPSMEGFDPAKLPLTPNMKGHERKDMFRKEKESVRTDVVRYQAEPTRPQDSLLSGYQQYQGHSYDHSFTDMKQHPSLLHKSITPSVPYQSKDHPHFRQRSLSEDCDGVLGSDKSNGESHPQHTIVKPMANSQNYDHLESFSQSHTPVQSGLATLPRNKKEQSKDSPDYQRQTTGMTQDGLNRPGTIGNLSSVQDQRATPSISGRPPPVPGKTSNEKAEGKKNAESEKKTKKLTKKELKKAEKKKLKSDLSRSQPDLTGIGKTPLHPSVPMSSSNSNDNVQQVMELGDYKMTYIDRKMVESILKHQGLQRNPSTHSTNSSSSIDSDSVMGRLLAGKNSDGSVHTDVSFDNVSLGSHKDSGYGSSDRNSSSSTGSGTIDPYTQYFISKSMVVPRNLHSQFPPHLTHQMITDFRAPKPQVYNASAGQTEGQHKDLSTMSREEMNRHLYETLTQRKVMHPIKESSQEDILNVLPPKDQAQSSAPAGGSSILHAPDGLSKEGRAPPIPPKNFAAFQVSKSSHQREPSIDSLDKDEVENDYFISMCEKADDLMDSCIIAETKGDLTSAMQFCDSALGCLKEAMNQTDISNKALVYAQKKHNACLLKSRSLFKRSASQAASDGKRSSVTSSDSDNSDKPIRRAPSKEYLLALGRGAATPGQGHNIQQDSAGSSTRKSPVSSLQQSVSSATQLRDGQSKESQLSKKSYPNIGPHSALHDQSQQSHRPRSHMSRSSAADKSDSESNHSRSESSSSTRSSVSMPCPESQASVLQAKTIETLPSARASSGTPVFVDSFGPQSRGRQPRRTSDPTGSSEVYKACLNRQKNIQNANGSDSSSDGTVQKKLNQTEMRGLLENNIVQRQMQQLAIQSQKQNNVPGYRQQVMDMKSHTGQKICNNSIVQNRNINNENAGNITPVNDLSIPFVERAYHYSPGPSESQNIQTNHQYRQGNSNCHSTVSPNQSVPQSVPSPQFSSGSVQLLQQPQHHQQTTVSHTDASQNQLHPYHQRFQEHLSQNQQSGFPAQGQTTDQVSGYRQPLPVYRPMPQFSQQGSKVNAQHEFSGNQSQTYGYYHQNLQSQQMQQSKTTRNNSQHQTDFSQEETSCTVNQFTDSQNSSVNHLKTSQQNIVHGVVQGVQNLNTSRKNSGGLPPPPPARTTSNPDFKQQLPPQHQFSHQAEYHHPQQGGGANSEVGSGSKQRSHAQVLSGSRVVNSEFRTPQQGHTVSTAFGPDRVYAQGAQLKHATSTTGLNYISMSPRPLERYASQPDCKNLIDPASYSHPDCLPSSSAPDHMLSTNTFAKPENKTGNGVNRNLLLTSDCHQFQKHGGQDPGDTLQEQAEPTPSVRALASKFDAAPNKPAIKPKPSLFGLPRTRSKSESRTSKSESSSKKPKSALKCKKNKNSKMPRKSVTFAEDIYNLAAGYESAAELTSFSASGCANNRVYFSDDEDNLPSKPKAFSDNELDDGVEDSSTSDDTPMVREELACQLCRKREIESGKAYCSKCAFYMSRLVQS